MARPRYTGSELDPQNPLCPLQFAPRHHCHENEVLSYHILHATIAMMPLPITRSRRGITRKELNLRFFVGPANLSLRLSNI